jgi:hypothetical protein
VLGRNGEVSEYAILDFERDLTPATYPSASTPSRLIKVGEETCVVSRRSVPDGFHSSFDILKPDGRVKVSDVSSDSKNIPVVYIQ